jgi:predicted carbohydrate-binding protein with CBM5 and CBM33 domain
MAKLASAVVSAVVALLGAASVTAFGAVFAVSAYAHGAPDIPVSRAVACGPEAAQYGQSTACRAALAQGGGPAFTAWDNLRLPNVNGRDRQVVPDGKLCSAGLPLYRVLDLPRADWPATQVPAGAPFTFSYRETIPHTGTFRLYVTRDGYVSTRPLTWSDLDAKPFLTATNPVLRDGAYTMRGVLPRKSGRHLIYTIWQNTSTPDTYYSCSDVIFTASGAGSSGGGPAGSPATRGAVAGGPAASAPAVAAPSTAAQSGRTPTRLAWSTGTGPLVSVAALAAAGLAAIGTVTAFVLRPRRSAPNVSDAVTRSGPAERAGVRPATRRRRRRSDGR